MGIDIYAQPIYSQHYDRVQPKFEAACAKRDSIERDSTAAAKTQGEVLKLYDDMRSVGYLRESYHGGPYVTHYLVGEAFEEDARIPAATLRERLPVAVLLAVYRNHVVYQEALEPVGPVFLGEGKAGDRQFLDSMGVLIAEAGREKDVEINELTSRIAPEQIAAVAKAIAAGEVPKAGKRFVAFVEQCEAYEAEHGEPCTIQASY